MIRKFLLPVALGLAVPVMSQMPVQSPPVGYSGELISYAATSVVLKDKAGQAVTLAMSPGWTVSRPRKVPLSAVKAGDFVASANTVVDDGTGRSTEVRIMEPGYRPEYGTHLMAAQSGTAMTHGTVAATRKAGDAVELSVTYPGGSRRLLVPQEMQVTDFMLLSRDVLKPGTKVGAVARRGEDGVLRAGRLTLDP